MILTVGLTERQSVPERIDCTAPLFQESWRELTSGAGGRGFLQGCVAHVNWLVLLGVYKRQNVLRALP